MISCLASGSSWALQWNDCTMKHICFIGAGGFCHRQVSTHCLASRLCWAFCAVGDSQFGMRHDSRRSACWQCLCAVQFQRVCLKPWSRVVVWRKLKAVARSTDAEGLCCRALWTKSAEEWHPRFLLIAKTCRNFHWKGMRVHLLCKFQHARSISYSQHHELGLTRDLQIWHPHRLFSWLWKSFSEDLGL